MPRDDHHRPKSERTFGDTAPMRALKSWLARVLVPAVANTAADGEMAVREWAMAGNPSRADRMAVVAGRVRAQPLTVLAILGGVAYVFAAVRSPRGSKEGKSLLFLKKKKQKDFCL